MNIPERVYTSQDHLDLAMEFAQYQAQADEVIKKQEQLNISQAKLIVVLKNELRKYDPTLTF